MKRNSRALDALNFCNAGIQTGLGPFISIYYGSSRHWDPARIGILLITKRALLKDRRILIYTLAVVLFNVSNSATLPPVGQLFTRQGHHGRSAAWQTAMAVLVAETVMVGTAFVTGRGAAKR
ncbi:MAG TPA: hypothetical protein VLT58_15810, partial [Polyangia bacterium]|nr:hypothetical protein [Polyangia bacterium]